MGFRILLIPAGLLLIYIVSVGALGYFINDIFDITEDYRAGRKNYLEGISTSMRILMVIVCIVVATIPAFVLPGIARTYLCLTAFQLLLFFLYSAPPFRLKKRGGGLVADALFSFLIPGLIAIVLAGNKLLSELLSSSIFIVALWLFFIGFRSILIHQIKDVEIDIRAGVKTFTTGHGKLFSTALAKFALIIEFVLLGLITVKASVYMLPVILNAPALYLIIEWGIDRHLQNDNFNINTVTSELNQFYNIYLFAAIAFMSTLNIHFAFFIPAMGILVYRLQNEFGQLIRKFYYSVILHLAYKMKGLWRRITGKMR